MVKQVIETERYSEFDCADCKRHIRHEIKVGTGYATMPNGDKVCYSCCGERDKAHMKEHGRIALYLVPHKCDDPVTCNHVNREYDVTNWPDTLRFNVGTVRISRHNFGCKRRDFWFTGPDGKLWHGYQIGENTQIAHCKRTSSR